MTVQPIKLYSSDTPNGMKINIAAEMMGLQMDKTPIDMAKNEQKEEWFLKINPNGRFPAIVDPNNGDMKLWESGAILMYLADRYDTSGKLFPKDSNTRALITQWLMFQMSGIGPMFGQVMHFMVYAPEANNYGISRYYNEMERLIMVMNKHLTESGSKFICGDDITLADIAIVPWMSAPQIFGVDESKYPAVQQYMNRIMENPAFIKTVGEKRKEMMADATMQERRKKALERKAAAGL